MIIVKITLISFIISIVIIGLLVDLYRQHVYFTKTDNKTYYYGTYNDFIEEFNKIPINEWQTSQNSNLMIYSSDYGVSLFGYGSFKFRNTGMVMRNTKDFILAIMHIFNFVVNIKRSFKKDEILHWKNNMKKDL